MLQIRSILWLTISFFSSFTFALTAEKYAQTPKLVVLIVIDQFRADYLTRFEKQFVAPGTSKAPGGFRFLMKNGAYYPFAEYDSLQNMTCPGHATIATGSRPATFGFSTNEWFDPSTKKIVYCADDPKHQLSPFHLLTTTFGDELRLVHDKSKVIAVSLKDRSAIMLGGHKANLALWYDHKGNRWATSTYYNKGELPKWVAPINESLAKASTSASPVAASLEGATRGTQISFEAALAAAKAEKLGQGPETDVLIVSLSAHDILGHNLGPNSSAMEKLTLVEDKALADFLKKLSVQLGSLDRTVIALTADHGIPPNAEVLKDTNLQTGQIDFLELTKKITARLDTRFGSPGKETWIIAQNLFHFYLNRDLIKTKNLEVNDVENEIRSILQDEEGVLTVFTRGDFEAGRFPPGFIGEEIKHSYVPQLDGDLLVVPKAFFTNKDRHTVTHITGYSYDRSVPLIIFGKSVRPGVYTGAKVIDLAPTLSFLLRVLPPAKSEGQVLKDIF